MVSKKRVVLADVPLERKPERGYVRMFLPERKPERGYVRMFPRNEGTFAKTTLLRNRPFVSRLTLGSAPSPPELLFRCPNSSERRVLWDLWPFAALVSQACSLHGPWITSPALRCTMLGTFSSFLALAVKRRRAADEANAKRHFQTTARLFIYQKNPRVHKIFVRNFGAGNGCANFMGTWKNCVLSAGKPMSIKFLVLAAGGGGLGFFGGGGVSILFLCARGFF